MRKFILLICFLAVSALTQAQQNTYQIQSPDKSITVNFNVAEMTYAISYIGKPLLNTSKLGLVRKDEDFTKNLKLVKASASKIVKDDYQILNAKKKNVSYRAMERVFETINSSGKKMNIIFRVSNDGVAFCYKFPDKLAEIKYITSEASTFHFFEGTKAWLQPKADAQTGFEHTNPSYEAHYMMDIPVGTPSNSSNGWVYPALFKYGNQWLLLTEASLGRTYSGTALQKNSPNGEYKIGFPQAQEKIEGGALNPQSELPWQTPWRIIAIGSLKTIMESTLGTDLAFPAKKMDSYFIKLGKSSWSWVLEKDKATIFPVQKKYIDYAADMNWQYCLIDANWDETIGYDSVQVLSDYAKEKNVGLLLWYNSAGDWNTVKFTPRNKLLTHESRVKEFSLLEKMGIKGVKIDFFGGDGQSMINYYEDILEDAATYHLLVNFHGATLPRGLQRTYPNFVTAEAVFGYEMITFSQDAANKAPSHSVNSAMIRNVYDPMDFTPMALYQIPGIKRITTQTFELATSVVFLSGIQHFAETPDGMTHVPEDVKSFLRELPTHWDEVKFIDGFPGKYYVVARKGDGRWYFAGINGENKSRKVTIDLSGFSTNDLELFKDFENGTFDVIKMKNVTIKDNKLEIELKPNGGFILVQKD
ncbi:glycoside hydrolase family 97 protein [Pedobacter alpinus]|uniref:Glycoside hydrolase family 97 catalytic domain-containing protein n=1 Tax=Pedobacter alpinus TaxID=1590643 RepID=A0ABW5TVZ7_9SPHI